MKISNMHNSKFNLPTISCCLTTLLLSLTMCSTMAHASNLMFTHLDAISTDTESNSMVFTTSLTQEFSWKNTTNSDAIWIFMKYSVDAGQTWNHASMAMSGTNPTGFSAPDEFDIIVPSDEKGFFLQRADFGSGDIAVENIQFIWDYGQDGLSDDEAQAANTYHNIYGIEMVYIPSGSFFAGDGSSSSRYGFTQGSSDADPWYVQSSASISTTSLASDSYYYNSSSATGETASGSRFILSNSFPKGFDAFYLMKYELTESEYVNFFNSLSVNQKINRDITSSFQGGKGSDSIVNRNTISWDSTNVLSKATTLRPFRAVSYLSWPDAAAFADWAALRPLTELEFEKAARGADVEPTANELAWGTDAYDQAGSGEIYPVAADEDGSESIYDGNANLNRNELGWTSGDGRFGGNAEGQVGPLRVGIFAENSTNRVTSGAGYYGNMELSGNLSEPVVSIGRVEGRKFLGTHGDGALTSVSGYEGFASNSDWPGIDSVDASRGVTRTVGIGYRGGNFASADARSYQVSDRAFASKDPDSEGFAQRYDAGYGLWQGARFVRSAP